MPETFVFKEIGSEAITKVTASAVLKILRQLEAKHHHEPRGEPSSASGRSCATPSPRGVRNGT
jgi:hypothetical protein